MRKPSANLSWLRQSSSLKLELAIGFGVLIVLTLVLGVASYLSERRSVLAVNKLLTIDNRMADLSLRAAQAMLKARRVESDLLLSQDELGMAAASERFVPMVLANLDDMREYLTSIQILSADPGLSDNLKQINVQIQQYRQGFLSLVDQSGKLDGTDSGWEGKFHRMGRQIEALINGPGEQRLMVEFRALRQHENAFVADRQDAQLRLFLASASRMRAQLPAAHLTEKQNRLLATLLMQYARYFQRFAPIRAAQHQYVQAALVIEPLLEALHTSATLRAIETRNSVESAASVTRRTIFIAAATATVLGAIVAFIVSRRITYAVRQLIVFSGRVAAGDLSARANQDGKHEFALVGRAMNQMAESIEKSHVLLTSNAAELKYQATHDALTGLPNRTLLKDRLRQAMLLAKRYDRQVTVAFIDLDNFKLINDSLGHNAGDELLKIMAERMQNCVRTTDTVVRIGGDEFVIILYDQPKKDDIRTSTLQAIFENVARTVRLNERDYSITCSMGLAIYPIDGKHANTLLMNADVAMYRAKELGRNNYQFYASEMNTRIHENNLMQEGLFNAIARDEFLLLYQPQVDLRSGLIIGVEALIRWQHPELGLVPPSKFIPQSEKTGLIVPIGDWVLQAACKQNKAWQDAGMPLMCMSVNVSARQFMEKNLIERVANALQQSGLEAKYLEVELTESVIMQDVEQAAATMVELTAMGVQISIDDFGTGYSSLSTLKHFPVARLKIDQSFIRDIPKDKDDMAIAMAIISLGHKLNLKVIAEGVENAQQLEFLRANDCDEMQGFHFSRPVSAEGIEKLFWKSARPGSNHLFISREI